MRSNSETALHRVGMQSKDGLLVASQTGRPAAASALINAMTLNMARLTHFRESEPLTAWTYHAQATADGSDVLNVMISDQPRTIIRQGGIIGSCRPPRQTGLTFSIEAPP